MHVSPREVVTRRGGGAGRGAVLAGWLLRLWAIVVLRDARVNVGGFVAERLQALDLGSAVPPGRPRLAGVETVVEYGSTDELLDRATAWGVALEDADGHGRMLSDTRGVLTTYGFACVRGKVQLAVIRYLPRRVAPAPRTVAPVLVDGHSFPVVLRPLVMAAHAGAGAPGAAGTCWVTLPAPAGTRLGILTAGHAVRPPGSSAGEHVSIAARRAEPPGRLHARGAVMDAAIVDVAEADGPVDLWQVSRRVGYKPVRLLSSRGPVDTDVIEISGVVAGTAIAGQPGQEPHPPVGLYLGRTLRRGDSGCLGLDLEPVEFGSEPVPYLIYQGRGGYRLAALGEGFLIEQARRVWDFDVCR